MKTLLFTVALMFHLFNAAAQPPGEPPTPEMLEKMKAHKVAYLTNELNLSSKEAQVFWPVYNEMDEKLHQLREVNRPGKKPELDAMSDKEIEELVEKHFNFRQQELDIQKEYLSKFKEILPVKKVAKLYKAEEDFKRQLLKRLQGDKPPKDRHPKDSR